MKQNNRSQIAPFIKWAGGKRWFTSRYSHLFPSTYNTYYEPFLGGAAAFFALSPEKAHLSDLNEDLIGVYLAIQSDWKKLERELRKHQRGHSKKYYYKVRSSSPRTLITKAARFLYLNRTCWNGLFRVNLKGAFNVPIGTKTNVILDTDDFEATSKLLKGVSLSVNDFETTINKAEKGDLIFADPPYTVKHNKNGFLKYNEKIFSWDDQVRLRDSLFSAANRGVKIVLTNANHKTVRKLYSDFPKPTVVKRASVLAANSKFRAPIEELVVRLCE